MPLVPVTVRVAFFFALKARRRSDTPTLVVGGAVGGNSPRGKAMKGLRVLVGMESITLSRQVHFTLEQKGCVVVAEVGNGRAAVERTKTVRPDLVILEVSLPELNGIDACRIINSDNSVPTILVGSETSEDVVESACKAGAMAYIFNVSGRPPFTSRGLCRLQVSRTGNVATGSDGPERGPRGKKSH